MFEKTEINKNMLPSKAASKPNDLLPILQMH